MLKKKNYVQQLDEADCGSAVLAMILRNYQSDISIAKIRSFAQTDSEGTTALGLIRAGEHFNLKSTAIKADMSLFDNMGQNLQLPCIAHLDKSNGTLHYVVILEVHKKFLLVADPDPSVKITKTNYGDFQKEWTGIAILMAPNSRYLPVKDDKDSLWDTAFLLLKQKKIISEIVLTTFMCTLITIYGAFFLQNLIDVYVPGNMTNTLNIIALGLLIAYIFHGIFTYTQGYLSIILGQRLSIDILLAYIKHLFKLPMSFFGTRKIGEITSRLTDASNIIQTLAETAISTLLNVGTILFVSIALSSISFKLFLVSLVIIPVYGIIIASFLRKFDQTNNERMEQEALLGSSLIEDLRGIESIKALGIEKQMYSHIDRRFVKGLKANYKYSIATVSQGALKDVAQLTITLMILYMGSRMAIRGSISVGQLMAFNALLGYLMNPIEAIIGLQSDLQTAKIANKRLNQVLLMPGEKTEKENTKIIADEGVKKISFKNVGFEYKYGQPVLKDINLEIKKGEKIAVVGLSGSGKTTLAKMLVGFYQVSRGQIEVNDIDIKTINKRLLRNNIAYLPQTPYIFSGSVLDNILLGTVKKNISISDAINVAKLAGIHQDIEALPDGYFTNLSENSGLSGGQRQRIAIARTLLTGASMMIFDESTSNLDVLTEKSIIDNLIKLPEQTIIFIAHRLEVAKKADRIVVMDHGNIIESGSHDELMKRHGKYYELWEG